MSKLDVFALARATKPKNYWDNLLMGEYGDYLRSGIAAARQGCSDRAHISTIDVVNPFPVLLDWPEGGGMFFAAAGYLTSKKAHLPDEVMFRDIDCVMVPKLPAQIGFRDALLDIYGPFLLQILRTIVRVGYVVRAQTPVAAFQLHEAQRLASGGFLSHNCGETDRAPLSNLALTPQRGNLGGPSDGD